MAEGLERVGLLKHIEEWTPATSSRTLLPSPQDPVLNQAPLTVGASSYFDFSASGRQNAFESEGQPDVDGMVDVSSPQPILGTSSTPHNPMPVPPRSAPLRPTLSTDLHSQVKSEMIGANGQKKQVIVLGSGDFGLALANRFARASYSVLVVSRNPSRIRQQVREFGGKVATTEEAHRHEEDMRVVVVALPFRIMQNLDDDSPLPDLLEGKILIDVSNREKPDMDPGNRSQAEILQMQFPRSTVVKAFNILSSHTLSQGVGGTQVPVCGNDDEARAVVSEMVQDLGFIPQDLGHLMNAREVENMPFVFFTAWKPALLLSLVIWGFFFLITIINLDVCLIVRNHKTSNATIDWSVFNALAKDNVSTSCASTALFLLSLCYLPGVLAGYLQLFRGTKYSEFPCCLDRWMKGRKQLGLIMLFNAAIHGVCELGGSERIGSVGSERIGSRGSWRYPTFLASGIYSLLLACILGLTSMRSVSVSLTWREFSRIQRYMGWMVFILAILHIVFLVWGNFFNFSFECYVPSIGQLVILLPLVTVLLKLPLLLPSVDTTLTNIRLGCFVSSAHQNG
ncbi:hypothetical protein Pcinc_027930 [Petrolisthes cinctipes]|uniref:Uncharacterized protein n=1 Tax=Petrolisthes cinctipes TaxID=88211 RepID=A0AAE1KA25_PETCI|nr:hypothetical protein Pcinc_027930 [Petrolisthes cinctipes]